MKFIVFSLIMFTCSCTPKEQEIAREVLEEAELAEKEAERLSQPVIVPPQTIKSTTPQPIEVPRPYIQT
jgi:hypothetical protein